jgi:membrane protein DedA with SNARE-associated domain
MVPVLMAAGVLQYPRKKFLAALTAGRAVRFLVVALLGRIYGTAIISSLQNYYKPMLYALIALAALGGIAVLVYFKWYRPKRQQRERRQGKPVEQFPVPFRNDHQDRSGG